MAPKLSTVEKRAKAYCSQLKEHDGGRIVIEWKKSRTWGSNPRIENWSGENCISVSGCGYCKESTALADFLAFLFEKGTPEHDSIRRTGGAGVSSVVDAMKKNGWTLEKVAGTQSADVYDLKKN